MKIYPAINFDELNYKFNSIMGCAKSNIKDPSLKSNK
jgi:hypothetical protein